MRGRGPPRRQTTRVRRGIKGRSRPVSRVLSWMAIHLGRTSPRASSDLPGGPADHRSRHAPHAPYLVLLRVGFALPPLLPAARCALTAPFHPCRRRAAPLGRYVFCGTFRGLAPPRRYLAPCPEEPGLSSTPCGAATIRPTPRPTLEQDHDAMQACALDPLKMPVTFPYLNHVFLTQGERR